MWYFFDLINTFWCIINSINIKEMILSDTIFQNDVMDAMDIAKKQLLYYKTYTTDISLDKLYIMYKYCDNLKYYLDHLLGCIKKDNVQGIYFYGNGLIKNLKDL